MEGGNGWRDRKLSLAFVGSQADAGKPAKVVMAIRRIALWSVSNPFLKDEMEICSYLDICEKRGPS